VLAVSAATASMLQTHRRWTDRLRLSAPAVVRWRIDCSNHGERPMGA
jgi:hypothetical protein